MSEVGTKKVQAEYVGHFLVSPALTLLHLLICLTLASRYLQHVVKVLDCPIHDVLWSLSIDLLWQLVDENLL